MGRDDPEGGADPGRATSVTKDYNVGGHAGAGIGGMSLSGYPVRTPVVDLVEIGAGGGSIAWVDSGGLLRVGPQSAGAEPGACLLPARRRRAHRDRRERRARPLNPTYFLGGEIGLDVEGAARAIEERCATPLGLERHRGGERDRRDRERGDGERASPRSRSSGAMTRGTSCSWASVAPARCTQTHLRETPRCRRC